MVRPVGFQVLSLAAFLLHETGTLKTAQYQQHGLAFQYPAHWTIAEELRDEELTVFVQSEGTSYWSVTLMPSCPDPEHVLDSVLDTYRQEYKEVDTYRVLDPAFSTPTLAVDLDFVYVDLVSTAAVRVFASERHTVLVVYQGLDDELESTRPLLEQITKTFGAHLQQASDELDTGSITIGDFAHDHGHDCQHDHDHDHDHHHDHDN